jgi:hypothetical protein
MDVCYGDAAAKFAHAVALHSPTGVSQRNRDSRSSSPELSSKTEGVSTRKLLSFTPSSSKWNKGCKRGKLLCS